MRPATAPLALAADAAAGRLATGAPHRRIDDTWTRDFVPAHDCRAHTAAAGGVHSEDSRLLWGFAACEEVAAAEAKETGAAGVDGAGAGLGAGVGGVTGPDELADCWLCLEGARLVHTPHDHVGAGRTVQQPTAGAGGGGGAGGLAPTWRALVHAGGRRRAPSS